jgi:hypothetical protein
MGGPVFWGKHLLQFFMFASAFHLVSNLIPDPDASSSMLGPWFRPSFFFKALGRLYSLRLVIEYSNANGSGTLIFSLFLSQALIQPEPLPINLPADPLFRPNIFLTWLPNFAALCTSHPSRVGSPSLPESFFVPRKHVNWREAQDLESSESLRGTGVTVNKIFPGEARVVAGSLQQQNKDHGWFRN